jgi:hypothetical protein
MANLNENIKKKDKIVEAKIQEEQKKELRKIFAKEGKNKKTQKNSVSKQAERAKKSILEKNPEKVLRQLDTIKTMVEKAFNNVEKQIKKEENKVLAGLKKINTSKNVGKNYIAKTSKDKVKIARG